MKHYYRKIKGNIATLKNININRVSSVILWYYYEITIHKIKKKYFNIMDTLYNSFQKIKRNIAIIIKNINI